MAWRAAQNVRPNVAAGAAALSNIISLVASYRPRNIRQSLRDLRGHVICDIKDPILMTRYACIRDLTTF